MEYYKKRESVYSGKRSDELVPGHDYLVRREQDPRELRRHPRIPCRNVKACIKTSTSAVVVDVVNLSRGGVFFMTAQKFSPGTAVSIAVHYMEGGQNLFQSCRIVRVHPAPDGAEWKGIAAEFSI